MTADLVAGLRLAFTMLTVLPLRSGRADRAAAAVAMALAPLVGLCVGAVLAAALWLLRQAHAPTLVAATLTAALGVAVTRGLHLDGLADTVDAFGSYRTGGAALSIMKKSDIGPFGVTAVVLTLLLQTGALTGAGTGPVVAAWATGRLAITLTCRQGVPAARGEGLGALVAGTVPRPLAAGVALAGVLAAAVATPGRPWQGPVAVAAALVTVVLLVRHAVRRFGGVTGDVLGAAAETGTTVALVGLTLG